MNIYQKVLLSIVSVFLSSFSLISCSNSQNLNSTDYEQFLQQQISKGSQDLISRPSLGEIIDLIQQGKTVVGFSWIDLPLNQVVLLRGSSSICGFKFVSYETKNDEKNPTVFDDGSNTKLAMAEFFDYESKTHSKIQLNKKSAIGIGRFNKSRGNYIIRCGSYEYLWSYPTGISTLSHDKQLAFAPTESNDFIKINALSSEYKWFEYDPKRQYFIIEAN